MYKFFIFLFVLILVILIWISYSKSFEEQDREIITLSQAPFIEQCPENKQFDEEDIAKCEACFDSYSQYTEQYYPFYTKSGGCSDSYKMKSLPINGEAIATNKAECRAPKCTFIHLKKVDKTKKGDEENENICMDMNRECDENDDCCSGHCMDGKCGFPK